VVKSLSCDEKIDEKDFVGGEQRSFKESCVTPNEPDARPVIHVSSSA